MRNANNRINGKYFLNFLNENSIVILSRFLSGGLSETTPVASSNLFLLFSLLLLSSFY